MDLTGIPIHDESVHISAISRTTVQLKMQRVKDDGEIIGNSNASGFIWRENNRSFLVTNRHVLSGANAISGTIMEFIPNKLEISLFAERPVSSGATQMVRLSAEVPILDQSEQPLWVDHPKGINLDVALLEIDNEIEGEFYIPSLNNTGILPRGELFVGDDIFIVGYPEGQAFDRSMPLWKRGSVATDVSLNQMGLPQIYVDTLGNKGLSGSPVLARVTSLDRPIARSPENEAQHLQFVGIYAGRLGEDGLNSQIGRVFKHQVLKETIANSSQDLENI